MWCVLRVALLQLCERSGGCCCGSGCERCNLSSKLERPLARTRCYSLRFLCMKHAMCWRGSLPFDEMSLWRQSGVQLQSLKCDCTIVAKRKPSIAPFACVPHGRFHSVPIRVPTELPLRSACAPRGETPGPPAAAEKPQARDGRGWIQDGC